MLKLLIVEDDIFVLESLAECLTLEGYEILTASFGKDGIAIVKEQNPEMILLDLYLKDMSGLQVLRAAKAANPKICVIVLTGFTKESTREKALQQGADYFLLKPISLSNLTAILAEAAKEIMEQKK